MRCHGLIEISLRADIHCQAAGTVRSAERQYKRSILFRRRAKLGALCAHRAELELRNFSERIERRIGQQVRRRLGVAERHEHHVLGTSRSERTLTSMAPRPSAAPLTGMFECLNFPNIVIHSNAQVVTSRLSQLLSTI